jgi:hypothetical protein
VTTSELLSTWFEAKLDPEAAWNGLIAGPSVEEVGERLSSAPRPFLDERTDVLALSGDVFSATTGPVLNAAFKIQSAGTPQCRAAATLALWVFASQELVGPLSVPLRTDRADRALLTLAFRLAPVVAPDQWLLDAERREEAARTLLLWSGHLPKGEDVPTARAQLELRDSVAKASALRDALADHEHRMAIARRLADARAREAAARYNSE